MRGEQVRQHAEGGTDDCGIRISVRRRCERHHEARFIQQWGNRIQYRHLQHRQSARSNRWGRRVILNGIQRRHVPDLNETRLGHFFNARDRDGRCRTDIPGNVIRRHLKNIIAQHQGNRVEREDPQVVRRYRLPGLRELDHGVRRSNAGQPDTPCARYQIINRAGVRLLSQAKAVDARPECVERERQGNKIR